MGVRAPMVAASLPRFVPDVAGLDVSHLQPKLFRCPHCGSVGFLVGHGMLRGYAERSGDRVIRGRRLLCSNRHRRRGCGRTVSVFSSSVLPNFMVSAITLFAFVLAVLLGRSSRLAAWTSTLGEALSVSTAYRLWRRLQCCQSRLRTRLCAIVPFGPSEETEPWSHLLEHFRSAFADSTCPFSAYQLAFQEPLLG